MANENINVMAIVWKVMSIIWEAMKYSMWENGYWNAMSKLYYFSYGY